MSDSAMTVASSSDQGELSDGELGRIVGGVDMSYLDPLFDTWESLVTDPDADFTDITTGLGALDAQGNLGMILSGSVQSLTKQFELAASLQAKMG